METTGTTQRKNPAWTVVTILLSVAILLQLGILFQRQVLLQRRSVATEGATDSWAQRLSNRLSWLGRSRQAPPPAAITPDTVWDGSTRMAQMHAHINRMFEEAFHDSFRFPLAPAVVSSPPTSNGSAPPDPFRTMRDMRREIDALFNEALRETHGRHAGFDDGWADLAITPGMTVKESGESYEITVALPSVDKSDIHLNMDGTILMLRVDHSEATKAGTAPATTHSRRISRFEQRLKLPAADPDPAHISASFENGILRIVVPKRSGNDYERGSIKVI